MGLSTSQSITRYGRPSGSVGSGLKPGSAYQVSLDQMGSFNTFSLNPTSYYDKKNGIDRFAMPDIAPGYGYDDQDGTYQLNIEAATIRPIPICNRQRMNGICDGWA